MLLDEVTEGLQPSVVDRLAEVLATTRRDRGTAMLVVEQHLPGTFLDSAALKLPDGSPVIAVTWERNRSRIELYNYARTAFDVGVARAF